ncbi:MAG: SGNH/GDSL hydrolase family protein, partial [Shinella sp.]|uniref:SGNH/GDSL hydrolase family protein n=1 Tax=Shinella sp. TaxID=1870904 RepID=UPI0040364877
MSMKTIVRFVRLGFALAVSASVVVTAMPASAQERTERKTILQLLFGTPKRKEIIREPEVRKPRTTVNRKKKKPTAVVAKPAPVVIEKLPEAKVVLVVGDFIAGSLGEGLATAFETTPGIVIERRTNGSSGIVRDDYYDWPASLPGLIAETKPALVVISMGANDRQQMPVAGEKEKFRSEAWTKEYEARVARLATLARDSGKPMLWVGMPAFQSSALTADMTTLNTIYRASVEKTGGEFVDIWDGFVDENGKFVISGSDINGQQVRLRGSDGINFTKAGKRK